MEIFKNIKGLTIFEWLGWHFSADKPDRVRGLNLPYAWLDEFTAWRYDDTEPSAESPSATDHGKSASSVRAVANDYRIY